MRTDGCRHLHELDWKEAALFLGSSGAAVSIFLVSQIYEIGHLPVIGAWGLAVRAWPAWPSPGRGGMGGGRKIGKLIFPG